MNEISVLIIASSTSVGLTYHLTRLSVGLKKKGYNIIVMSSPREQTTGLFRELEAAGIEYFVSRYIDDGLIWNIRNCREDVRKVLEVRDVDIIHGNGAVHALESYLAVESLSSNTKPSIVTSVHSVPWSGIFRRPRCVIAAKIIGIASDVILPVSNYTRELLVGHGVSSERTRIVYNALDLEVFDNHARNSFVDLDMVGNDEPTIVLAANLDPVKGQEYYLMAAAKVLRTHRAKFYLIGDGPRRQHLVELAHRLGIQKDVVFTGRIDWPQLYYVLSNVADICVSSSLYENFPFYILECMAAGKPIVASMVGGVPEAITEGVNGYLVPPREPKSMAAGILRLIGDQDEAEKMGARGRLLVEQRFSMPVLAENLGNVYWLAMDRK